MKLYQLIFSNTWPNRFNRHLIFWVIIFLYHLVRISFLYLPEDVEKMAGSIITGALIWGVLTNMMISYSVVYFVVPKFLIRKKYLMFAVSILMLYIGALGFGALTSYLNREMLHAIGTTPNQPYIFLRGTALRILGNPPLICGLVLSFKTLKNWHLEQLENETLNKETTNAELQLLKAQIHPHFLFNTLNNIYSFTLTKSPQAPLLIQKLSDILNYMIIDCEHSLVPLAKEIQLIKDYIDLEKVRYDEGLHIHLRINGDYKNKMIAPLLMSPFVENSFKHGASLMREKQWVKLIINIKDDNLEFNLTNSKPAGEKSQNVKTGIGLTNVKQRLKLLYPGNHQLNIDSTENTFSVNLNITLQSLVRANTLN